MLDGALQGVLEPSYNSASVCTPAGTGSSPPKKKPECQKALPQSVSLLFSSMGTRWGWQKSLLRLGQGYLPTLPRQALLSSGMGHSLWSHPGHCGELSSIPGPHSMPEAPSIVITTEVS